MNRFLFSFLLGLYALSVAAQDIPADSTTRPRPGRFKQSVINGRQYIKGATGNALPQPTMAEVSGRLPFASHQELRASPAAALAPVVSLATGTLLTYDPGDSTTPDDSVNCVVVQGRRYKANYQAAGIQADGYATLQRAIKAGELRQCVVYLTPGKSYQAPVNGLKVNLGKTRLIGLNSTIEGTLMSSGAIITASGSGTATVPYFQASNGLQGIRIVGRTNNTIPASLTGLVFDTPTESGTSHYNIQGIIIDHCDAALQMRNNAYCLNFWGCDFNACNVNVDITAGTNSGESNRFFGCTSFNSGLSYRQNNGASDTYWYGGSMDYNAKQIEILQGRLNLFGAHIEGQNYANYPITIAGDGSSLIMEGGAVISTGSTVKPVAYFNVNTSAGYGGLVKARDVAFDNTATTSGYIADGPGDFIPDGLYSYDYGISAKLTSRNNNLFLDGGMEGAAPIDDYIVSGTSSNVNNFSATNAELSYSTAYKHTGNQSLRINKVYGAGSESKVTVYVPIDRLKATGAELYYNKPGSNTGQLYFTVSFVGGFRRNGGVPSATKTQNIGSQTINLTSAATGWQFFTTGSPVTRAPAWATDVAVEINLFGYNSAGESIYIDDLFAGQY